MKKIALITTGGTIGSIFSPHCAEVDPSTSRLAKEIADVQKRVGCRVTVTAAFNEHSEALSPAHWLTLLCAIEHADATNCDAIVITHGTDTLAYSIASTLCFSQRFSKPIIFTGAFYPPDHPHSDASLNLEAALAYAVSTPLHGVYCAFRNSNNNSEAAIIRGSHIKPMQSDDLYFRPLYNCTTATYSKESRMFTPSLSTTLTTPTIESHKLPTITELMNSTKKVSLFSIYPGMSYDDLVAISNNRAIVVLQPYHSGTAAVEAHYPDLIQFLERKREDLEIVVAPFPKRFIEKPYKSSCTLLSHGAKIYGDLQAHFLYVYILYCISLRLCTKEILTRLKKWEI